MALNIKNEQVEAAARELARRTGESLTEAVLQALQERLARTESKEAPLAAELADIRRRCAKLPVRDRRSPEEILGYDQQGLPR